MGRGPLLPPPDIAGPKILLALIWAAGLTVGVVAGPVVLALLLAPVAAVAAAQVARSWKGHRGRAPVPQAAMATAAVMVAGSAFGIFSLVATAVVAAIGGAAWASMLITRRAPKGATSGAGIPAATADIMLTLVCAIVPTVAAVGPVLLRGDGLVASLVLVTSVGVYDAAAWIVGSGTRHHWTGPLSGMACIASVTVLVGAVFPQFRGDSAWQLGALAIILTPLGAPIATLVLGSRRAKVPALRRLDSLVVVGPLWTLAAFRLLG